MGVAHPKLFIHPWLIQPVVYLDTREQCTVLVLVLYCARYLYGTRSYSIHIHGTSQYEQPWRIARSVDDDNNSSNAHKVKH